VLRLKDVAQLNCSTWLGTTMFVRSVSSSTRLYNNLKQRLNKKFDFGHPAGIYLTSNRRPGHDSRAVRTTWNNYGSQSFTKTIADRETKLERTWALNIVWDKSMALPLLRSNGSLLSCTRVLCWYCWNRLRIYISLMPISRKGLTHFESCDEYDNLRYGVEVPLYDKTISKSPVDQSSLATQDTQVQSHIDLPFWYRLFDVDWATSRLSLYRSRNLTFGCK
jgi:hypothetical protein